ncbi:MAG: copper resistance protein CopC [Chloroflexota bacterium]|nr:copper resistance protein CopC [Chloroflexota bacterium]
MIQIALLRAFISGLALLGVVALAPHMTPPAAAHAELASANPPPDGSVTSLPSQLTLTFTEEVREDSVSVEVLGPRGERVDDGNAALDLTNPDRNVVRVSLFAGGAGAYTVSWRTVSNIDGDSASGSYRFSVVPAASPGAGSVGTPVAGVEPTGVIAETAMATVEPDADDAILGGRDDYDGTAFLISVGAGLVGLAAIVGFWFLVRPKNPRFGSRARPGQE